MSSIFEKLPERLREERMRLGMSQIDMASAGGVSETTQYRNEKSPKVIDIGYLESIASSGVDVLYVLTGLHGDQILDLREKPARYAVEEKTPAELAPLFDEIIKLWYSSTVTKEQVENWRKMFEMMNPFLSPQAARQSSAPTPTKAVADQPKTSQNDYSLFSRRPGPK